MTSFRTSLGQEFAIERHLPSIGWKPKFRGDAGSGSDLGGLGDMGGDDFGIFAVLGLIVLAVLLVLVLLPMLLFVAELALLVALVIPLMIFALVVGIKQHTVLLRDKASGLVVDQKSVHGVVGSIRAARAFKGAANAGRYQRV